MSVTPPSTVSRWQKPVSVSPSRRNLLEGGRGEGGTMHTHTHAVTVAQSGLGSEAVARLQVEDWG